MNTPDHRALPPEISFEDDRDFEIAKAVFGENWTQARALNAQLHRIPTLAMTLTGGLWFGAGFNTAIEPVARILLFGLAAASNITLILVLYRIRNVFQCYLEATKRFAGRWAAAEDPDEKRLYFLKAFGMVKSFASLMAAAAVVSILAAVWTFVCGTPEGHSIAFGGSSLE